jgi:acyl-coenzyme A synthetase/AMP-(fatty) acid ligase
VEAALISHESVLEAAVVAFEDHEKLMKPRAFVVLKAGEKGDKEALKTHVKGKIGLYKYPREIEFVESLPKTATGKIQRFKLRS